MLRADARARAARQVWLHAWDAGRRAETRNGRPMTKKEQRLYRDVLWQDLRRLRRKSRFARRLAAAGARAVRAAGPRGNPRMADPLTRSVDRLASALETFTAAVVRGKDSPGRYLALPPDAPIAIASITADDVRELGPAANVRDLYHLTSAVGDFATAYAPKDLHPSLRLRRPRGLPPVPDTTVSIFESTADQDIIGLEAEVLELAELVEIYQGIAAGVLDLAADVLEKTVAA